MINSYKKISFSILLISNFFYAASVLAASPASYTAGLFNVVRAQQQGGGDFGGFGSGGFPQGGGGGGMMMPGMGGMGPMGGGGGGGMGMPGMGGPMDGGQERQSLMFGDVSFGDAIRDNGTAVGLLCTDEEGCTQLFEDSIAGMGFKLPKVSEIKKSGNPLNQFFRLAQKTISHLSANRFLQMIQPMVMDSAHNKFEEYMQAANDADDPAADLEEAGKFAKTLPKNIRIALEGELKMRKMEFAMQEKGMEMQNEMMAKGQDVAEKSMALRKKQMTDMMEKQSQEGGGGELTSYEHGPMGGGGMPGMMGGMGRMRRGPMQGDYSPPVGSGGDHGEMGGNMGMGGGNWQNNNGSMDNNQNQQGDHGPRGDISGGNQVQMGGGSGGPPSQGDCIRDPKICLNYQQVHRTSSPESSSASVPTPVPTTAPSPITPPSAMNSSYVDYVAQVSKKASKKSPVVKKKSPKRLMSPTFY